MFVELRGKHTLAFRDQYTINLDEELLGHPNEANQVIDEIFNLDQVLFAHPRICGSGSGEDVKRWIQVEVTTKPIDNDEECQAFNEILKDIRGVRFAQPIKSLPATADEQIEYLYGGKRSKL